MKDAGTKSPILKMLFFSYPIIPKSLYMYESMIFDFFSTKFSMQKSFGDQKAFYPFYHFILKMAIFGLRMAQKGPFRIKNHYFCLPTCVTMVKELPVIWDALIL